MKIKKILLFLVLLGFMSSLCTINASDNSSAITEYADESSVDIGKITSSTFNYASANQIDYEVKIDISGVDDSTKDVLNQIKDGLAVDQYFMLENSDNYEIFEVTKKPDIDIEGNTMIVKGQATDEGNHPLITSVENSKIVGLSFDPIDSDKSYRTNDFTKYADKMVNQLANLWDQMQN